jgi:xylan 1,4-beta-xylosidase
LGFVSFGKSKNAYLIKEKDIFIVNRYQVRSINLSKGGAAISLSIPMELIVSLHPENAGSGFECKSFLYPDENQDSFDVVRRDFTRAFTTYFKNESYSPVMLRSRVGVLLSDLIQFFPAQKKLNDTVTRTGLEHLRSITNYIHSHFKDVITLRELSSICYLSTSYISR